MAIPDYQEFDVALASSHFRWHGTSHPRRGEHIADVLGLTEEERVQLKPNGQQTYLDNRTGWASTYLKKAGLLDGPQRASSKLLRKDRMSFNRRQSRLDYDFLEPLPAFVDFRRRRTQGNTIDDSEANEAEVPLGER